LGLRNLLSFFLVNGPGKKASQFAGLGNEEDSHADSVAGRGGGIQIPSSMPCRKPKGSFFKEKKVSASRASKGEPP